VSRVGRREGTGDPRQRAVLVVEPRADASAFGVVGAFAWFAARGAREGFRESNEASKGEGQGRAREATGRSGLSPESESERASSSSSSSSPPPGRAFVPSAARDLRGSGRGRELSGRGGGGRDTGDLVLSPRCCCCCCCCCCGGVAGEMRFSAACARAISRAGKYDLGAISGAMAASNEETRPRALPGDTAGDTTLCRGEGGTRKLMALRDAITGEWWSNAMRHGRRVISMLFLPVMHGNARANTHECASTHSVGTCDGQIC